MAKQEFIPELHDIGKLISNAAKTHLGLPKNIHTVADVNFAAFPFSQPLSPSWWGQYHHFGWDERLQFWVEGSGQQITGLSQVPVAQWTFDPALVDEDRHNLFLLILADHLAASASRTTRSGGRGATQEGVVKLWYQKFYKQEAQVSWAVFTSPEELSTLFQEIDECETSQKFLTRYEPYLHVAPEDKSVPRNVTSLYTHLELVGKIFRVLKDTSTTIVRENDTVSVKYDDHAVQTIREAEGGNRFQGEEEVQAGHWQAKLVKCQVTFPHSFVRLRDINLLARQAELIQQTVDAYPDKVLFATSDFLMLFLPAGASAEPLLQPFQKAGFHLHLTEIQADLGILNSALDRQRFQATAAGTSLVLDERRTTVCKTTLLPEIPTELPGPLCDICQQELGDIKEDGNIREWVGATCQTMREMGEPFEEYGNVWEPRGVKVCWFKFTLDQEKLTDWLLEVFADYVGGDSKSLEEFRPLALQVDFANDYHDLLARFWKQFGEHKHVRAPIAGYTEIGVCKYSPELTNTLIKAYQTLFQTVFPDCASDEQSPISLSLSISNIKYPIRDHWKYFEHPQKSWLNLRYHDVCEEAYTLAEVETIQTHLIEAWVSHTFLHNLIAIHDRLQSDLYLSLEIFNNRRRHKQPYEVLTSGISPVSFLNFYRIVKG